MAKASRGAMNEMVDEDTRPAATWVTESLSDRAFEQVLNAEDYLILWMT